MDIFTNIINAKVGLLWKQSEALKRKNRFVTKDCVVFFSVYILFADEVVGGHAGKKITGIDFRKKNARYTSFRVTDLKEKL